jgi:multicomponent K+:H+ antiporter subunit G
MISGLPLWVQVLVGLLLVASGVLVLAGALGLLWLKNFFQRMHAPALAYTLGTWCVALASGLFFSSVEARAALHSWLIPILLAIAAPVTTTLLARAGLFRQRQEGVLHARKEPADSLPAQLE